MRRFYLWFILFGMFGAFFEMLIGIGMNIFYIPYFYIYYNNFTTSWESFFLFGIFGCIGLRIVLTRYDLIRKEEFNLELILGEEI
jgi:hypothetical protein